MGDVIDSAHDEQLLGLTLDDGVDAVDQSLDNVANDAAVLDMPVTHQFVELTAVGKAVAQHNDVLLANGQLVEQGCSANVVRVLIGLGYGG